MNNMLQGFAMLMSLTIETVVLLFVAWKGGEWLDGKFPMAISWSIVLFPLVFLSIGHTVYKVSKMASKQKENEKS